MCGGGEDPLAAGRRCNNTVWRELELDLVVVVARQPVAALGVVDGRRPSRPPGSAPAQARQPPRYDRRRVKACPADVPRVPCWSNVCVRASSATVSFTCTFVCKCVCVCVCINKLHRRTLAGHRKNAGNTPTPQKPKFQKKINHVGAVTAARGVSIATLRRRTRERDETDRQTYLVYYLTKH